MTIMQDKLDELMDLRAEARLGGGKERIEKHHSQGKMTARERALQRQSRVSQPPGS